MIAVTGIEAYKRNHVISIEDSQIKQKWRTDEVEW
jgi:tRNA A37 threonylcarbamoyltransferase TsaD